MRRSHEQWFHFTLEPRYFSAVDEIREAVETGPEISGTRCTDLHVWRVGRGAYACAVSLVTHDPQLTAADVRKQLAVHEEIVHVTAEIQQCR